jgi:hypothetical protein
MSSVHSVRLIHRCFSLPPIGNFGIGPFSYQDAFSALSLYDKLCAVPEGAMKLVGLFIPMILLLATSVAGQQSQGMQASGAQPQVTATPLPFPTRPDALIICAGNVPPENMAITATGTSFTCSGSCRSRQVDLVEGPIMIICAGQPIPQYYETESITSSPACNCLGDQDNAYVIRRLATAPSPTPTQTQESNPNFANPPRRP